MAVDLNWIGDPISTIDPAEREVTTAKDSVLAAVAPLLQREVDLDGLLARIVEGVIAAVGADRGTLYLVDPERGELVSRAAHLPELREIRLKIGQGIAGTVAQTGVGVNLPAAERDRRFFRSIDAQTGYRTRSVMAQPLRDAAGHVIGVIQVLNARRGAFHADDEATLKRLAAEAALAIESTSLGPQVRPRPRPAGGPPLPLAYRYNRVVGESPAMRKVYALVDKAAPTDATVLLRGESGTGKELFARAIHYNGPRRDGPFIKVDCATIPPTLVENELFGHERGAFTGADARAIGRLEAADGGTLFIDELGELPLGAQAKLLRFVQDRELERVGGTRTVRADVRVIAATHRDLEAMVGRGEFREDLYWRVKVVQIPLPPLRERGAEDILRLAEHFLSVYQKKHRKAVELSPPARARLVAHAWPGNIRELEHCIESAVVLSDGPLVEAAHLPLPATAAAAAAAAPTAKPDGAFRPRPLADVEREHIAATLAYCHGNRSRAAALLGIGRNTLLRKLRGA
jgi:Nif-specific regulatory protein